MESLQALRRRVRKLTIETETGWYGGGRDEIITIGDCRSVFVALAAEFPQGKVFPNLQNLIWRDRTLVQYLFLFVQPSLRSATGFFSRTWEEDTIIYIRTLAASAPRLQELELEPDNDRRSTNAMSEALNRAICSLLSLTKVRVQAELSPKALCHLSTLRQLADLTLPLIPIDYQTVFSASTQPKFASLRSVDLNCSPEYVEHLVNFLDAIESPMLDKIHICLGHTFYPRDDTVVPSPLTVAIISSLFSTISHFENCTELCIEAELVSAPGPLAITTIQPLLQLKAIQTLDIAPFPFALVSQDFQAISHAFPGLTDLNLGRGSEANVGGATPTDLLHFARHCPKLCTLSLPLVCEPMAIPLTGRLGSHRLESRLMSLVLGQTILGDPVSFAAFLSDVFPYAAIPSNGSSPGIAYGEWAERVDEPRRLMRAFISVRIQERQTWVDQSNTVLQGVAEALVLASGNVRRMFSGQSAVAESDFTMASNTRFVLSLLCSE